MINSNPYIMYLIVKGSLNMTPGKLAVQCGHAVQMYIINVYCNKDTDTKFTEWIKDDYRKVVLKASDNEFEKIKNQFKERERFIVIDSGYTELQNRTETVIALQPMLKTNVPKNIKRLRLY